ncbi:Phospholipase/carboxylesteras-like protein [Emiliania huxleyi CCMP1516]|uniref:Phospholipase/carboxylesterase/thioesterase domain-containing protein n=2 Tax=Emiliania huxleyi TaxID=2903 RepID=A0A0D3JUH0_EMIH1|nr:Phospholipase/carboxylesteras-like protein [Emiliania huxleyi CCMP1516]EOD27155.1 Phospholipase/carboxylesteras-like protein [Emiliania huxleyi CCMP1516]|eukprot:XP_005779584.1 Phospholipase/carboxylesteras-like protein [Emiliania huxleyi CCMP1516]
MCAGAVRALLFAWLLAATVRATALAAAEPSRRQTCCSEDAVTCGVTCSGCLPCFGCIGPAALNPLCYPCVGCIPCLTSCAEYLDCYSTEPDCSNSMWWGTPPRARSWTVGTESCASPPCALILAFHGWTMSDELMREVTDMDRIAQQHGGAIVVYPDGIGVDIWSCWSIPNAANLGQCLFDAGVDDVGFVDALIDRMIERYSIDAGRAHLDAQGRGHNSLPRAAHSSPRFTT